jgi:hypothetical protein
LITRLQFDGHIGKAVGGKLAESNRKTEPLGRDKPDQFTGFQKKQPEVMGAPNEIVEKSRKSNIMKLDLQRFSNGRQRAEKYASN